jgi:GNAT superfamily N-acetyltransferase
MITVRRASSDDLELAAVAYVAGWQQGFRDMFSAAVFARDDFVIDRCSEVRGALLDEDTTISVVELDGRVVGFTGVSTIDATPCLDDVWVHPNAWGSGVATALISATEDEFRNVGVTRMTTWVPEDSPRARRLFDKSGWTPTGEIEALGVYPEEPNRLFEYDRVLI